MDGAVFLTRVVLENYKSIARCDVRLGPLTYLVGPNGAGKSNFLDALRFVADALTHSVSDALRSRGGGASICYAPHKAQGYYRIHLELAGAAGRSGHYAVKIGQSRTSKPSDPWEVLEEQVRFPGQIERVSSGKRGPPHLFQDRLGLALMANEPAYCDFYLALTRMLFYNIKPRSIEDVTTFDPGQFLPADGSNLASILFSLGFPPEQAAERINEYLRLVLPGLKYVRAEPVFRDPTGPAPIEAQKVGLLFTQGFPGKGVHLFWPSQMSEGTLRALGILTALFQAAVGQRPRPSLVAIEEPEAQVHPATLGVIRDAMLEASYSTQVLVATQSADLLDNKDVQTDSILAVTADEGETRIAALDAGSRDLIRRRLYTPGELLRIGQLVPDRGPEGNGMEGSAHPAAVGEQA